MLLAVGVFGHIIGSYETALHEVVLFVRNFIPAGSEELARNLEALSKQSNLLSGLGLLGLLWTGTQVFVILQQVMNLALGSRERIGFLRARGMALIIVVVAGALFSLSIGVTSVLTAVRQYEAKIWGVGPKDLDLVWDFFAILGPILVSILAFAFIYKFLPTKDIGTNGPVMGGVIAGLLFEAAKHAFRWYVTHVVSFSRIYGSLGGVLVMVVWIYYVSMITVIGAEIASVYARREKS
jgi:membrane protein